MTYSLQWRTPGLNNNKAAPIDVPAGAVVSDRASLRLTGKGAANYGKVQQENLLRLLETFAGPTPPDFPTVGMLWYDTLAGALKVASDTGSAATPTAATWTPIGGITVTDTATPPANPAFGDLWLQRTGEGSALLFINTGLGRWPEVTWSAYGAGYFPAPAGNALHIKANFDSFSTLNYGEAYVHGSTGVTPADVDGSILVGGVPTPVPRGACRTVGTGEVLVVWDTTATMAAATPGATHFFAVRVVDAGKYQYDNDARWVDFTPVAGMRAIGTMTITSSDDVAGSPGGTPGITDAVAWFSAVELTELVTSSASRLAGAVGGWEQVFPQVDTIAGRAEYDQALDLVQALVGSPDPQGGAGALGRSITNLTDFTSLDASLGAKFAALTPPDPNVLAPVGASATGLTVDAASRDWDTLLAAARYAVSRLDASAALVGDVGDLPLVQDGRQVDPSLLALSTSDPNYPGLVRRSNRRAGAVALVASWDDTLAALQAAAADRYSLKGVNGTTGNFPSYDPTVTVTPHSAFQGVVNGTTASVALTFRFDSADASRRFFNSGGVLEVSTRHLLPGSPSSQDTNLRNLCNAQGLFRLTADKTRVFPATGALTLVVPPIPGGAYSAASVPTTLTTRVSGTVSLSLAGAWAGSNFVLTVTATSTTTLSGTFGAAFKVAKSNDVFFVGPTAFDVYPGPAAYNGGDAATAPATIVYNGGALVDLPPVANFTANVTSGSAPLAVTFTDTSSNAPTLVEWDFTNDGSFDATGGTANHTYAAIGTYTVRSRATNGAGFDDEIKTNYITVAAAPPPPPPSNIFLSNDTFSTSIDGSDGAGNSGGMRSCSIALSNTGVLSLGGAIDPFPNSLGYSLPNQWYTGGCSPATASLYEVRFSQVTGTVGQSDAVKQLQVPSNQGVWLNLGTTRSSDFGIWIKQAGNSFSNDQLIKVEVRDVATATIQASAFYNFHMSSTYAIPCVPGTAYHTVNPVYAGTAHEMIYISGQISSMQVYRNGNLVSTAVAPYVTTLLLNESGLYTYSWTITSSCGATTTNSPFGPVTVQPRGFNVSVPGANSYNVPVGTPFSTGTIASANSAQFDAPVASIFISSGSLPPGLTLGTNSIAGTLTTAGSYSATFKAVPVANYTNFTESAPWTWTWTVT